MLDSEINIGQTEFIEANEIHKDVDIQCVFMSFGSRGPSVDLFKLPKSFGISSKESLIILQGKIACIGEEWNYKEYEHWDFLYNPGPGWGMMILKQFKPFPIKDFIEEFEGCLQYFKSDNCGFTITKPIQFNGDNAIEIYERENQLSSTEINDLRSLEKHEILNCYYSRVNAFRAMWFIETEDDFYLYEFNLGD